MDVSLYKTYAFQQRRSQCTSHMWGSPVTRPRSFVIYFIHYIPPLYISSKDRWDVRYQLYADDTEITLSISLKNLHISLDILT